MFRRFSKLFTFFRYVRLFDKKEVESYYLFVIDGPASIAISRLIVKNNTSLNLRFIASAHFLTRLKESDNLLKPNLVGWQLSTFMQGMFRYLSLCRDVKRILHVSQITSSSNAECMVRHIHSNAPFIKNIIVFNERSHFTALAVSTAKKYGIATSCIQHGAIVENYFPIQVDCYFTWSDYYSNLLQQRVPGLKTICVGRLGYKVPVNCRSDEKLNGLLLVLQPADVSIPRDEVISHFRDIVDVCYSYFNEITLRPHPNDNIIHDIVSHIGDRLYSIDSGNIDESLSRHSITISIYSTVLLEAPHYGSLPVQYIESFYASELMRRCELNAESPESLKKILQKLQDKRYFSEYLDKAKKYAEIRMNSGDISKLLEALEVTNLVC